MSWLPDLTDSDRAQVEDLVAAATAVDGVAPLSGHVLTAMDPVVGGNHYLLHRTADSLTGVAVAHHGDPVELVVHPDARRQGVGSELLAAALERGCGVWAHGELPAAVALAAQAGLVRTRLLLQLRRTGHPPVEVAPLPAGVRLRAFRPGIDDAAFLAVNARAFAWHPEQGRLDQAGLDAEMAQDWFDPQGFILAVDADDTVLGFHWTKVHPEDPTPKDGPGGPIGEIYVLGADPAAGVRGLGGPLTAAGLDHLARGGLDTVTLYVEGDNTPALKLYQRFGFTTWMRDAVYAPAAG